MERKRVFIRLFFVLTWGLGAKTFEVLHVARVLAPAVASSIPRDRLVGKLVMQAHEPRGAILRRLVAGGASLLLGAARTSVQGASAASLLEPPPPGESAGDSVGQNLRKAASSIPGMGPPDVGYPKEMLGRWSVQRLLVDVEFPQGQAGAEAPIGEELLERKGAIERYNVRFIQGKGGLTVADRDYIARSMARAIEGVNVEVQWKPSNPNVLTVSYPTGVLREVKVIARNPRSFNHPHAFKVLHDDSAS